MTVPAIKEESFLVLPRALYPLVENMAAMGKRDGDIRTELGLSPDAWRRLMSNDEELSESIARGRSRLHNRLVSKLLDKAEKGHTVELLFSLKSIFGYREGESPHAKPQTVNINVVNLPPAASPEQYLKDLVIEGEYESSDGGPGEGVQADEAAALPTGEGR